jgi:apolipoprotein N-acyltransferase
VPLGAAALSVAVAGHGVRRRAELGAVAGVTFYGTTLPWLTDFSLPGYVVVVVIETAPAGARAGCRAALVGPASRSGAARGGAEPLPAQRIPAAVTGSQPGRRPPRTRGTGRRSAAGDRSGRRRHGTGGTGAARRTATGGGDRGHCTDGRRFAAAGATGRTVDARVLDVAVVQGGGPRGTRAVFTDPAEVTARQLRVLDRISGSPDLVLLPEGVLVDAPLEDAPVNRQLARRTAFGQHACDRRRRGQGRRFSHVAVAYGPDGAVLGRYEKEHRVPFIEYIPGRRLLSRFSDATALVPTDAIVGRGVARLDTPAGRLGVVISYEVFFGDRVREAVDAGGQVVLLPTNASSYLGEEVPAAEVATARLRAREFGRAVLQAAPTGYSVIVMPDGRVSARGALGEPALLRSSVPLCTGRRPRCVTCRPSSSRWPCCSSPRRRYGCPVAARRRLLVGLPPAAAPSRLRHDRPAPAQSGGLRGASLGGAQHWLGETSRETPPERHSGSSAGPGAVALAVRLRAILSAEAQAVAQGSRTGRLDAAGAESHGRRSSTGTTTVSRSKAAGRHDGESNKGQRWRCTPVWPRCSCRACQQQRGAEPDVCATTGAGAPRAGRERGRPLRRRRGPQLAGAAGDRCRCRVRTRQ